MNNFFKNNYHILTYILLYSSLIIAFYFNENVAGGAKLDLQYTLKQVQLFEANFVYSFLNYDNIEFPNRLSPIYISILVIFKKIFVNFDFARFILMHIVLLSQIFFYKSLKIIYCNKFSLDKKIIFTLSCIILISPSFRSNIIWVESSMFGLLFFIIGLYYFLKNFKTFKQKNVYLNILFVAIAAYIRPSYCLFAIYFFYSYCTIFRKSISIPKIILTNFILAFPAYYYVFIMEIFFIEFGGLSNNYFNKIAIILSIIFFHIFPFFYYKNYFIKTTNKVSIILLSLLLSLTLIFYFNYDISLGGGGIFLHLSNFLLNNNNIFFLLIPFFIFYLINVCRINFINNSIIVLILLLITPQYHIFHKYYDPLVLILCLTIIDFKLEKNFFIEKKYIFFCYFVMLGHYFLTYINTYYIKF